MEWITDNWYIIAPIIAILIRIATVIVRKTKNKTDDKVVDIVKEIFGLSRFFKPKKK
jgi:hypothetical protein